MQRAWQRISVKIFFAADIHKLSKRFYGSFQQVHCSALYCFKKLRNNTNGPAAVYVGQDFNCSEFFPQKTDKPRKKYFDVLCFGCNWFKRGNRISDVRILFVSTSWSSRQSFIVFSEFVRPFMSNFIRTLANCENFCEHYCFKIWKFLNK